MSLHWYTCISMNTYCYWIYHILSEMVWWALSNASSIVWICPAIHEIIANKTFTVTDGLISWLFVVTFVHLTVMGHLNTNNFSFSFLLFFWFYIDFLFLFLFLLFLDDKEACDTTVTWQVTWYDVIGLEHGGKIWKMMSGHMYTTWWPWVGNEVDMRL